MKLNLNTRDPRDLTVVEKSIRQDVGKHLQAAEVGGPIIPFQLNNGSASVVDPPSQVKFFDFTYNLYTIMEEEQEV